MNVLLIALLAGGGFLLAYVTYGRWLGGRIFELSAKAVCPSIALRDDRDFVPTPKSVVFGHHFTSIAGTGPIVGPAIAIMWGWGPALAWIFVGSIFIGAVHDLGSLVVSLRNQGQTVGDIAGRLLNRRVRILFLLILFMALNIVLAIFGLVIAAVFRQFPAAIFPCLIQIPIAIAIGLWLHRQGKGLLLPSILALATMYVTVIFGNQGWLQTFNTALAGLPIITWVIVLLAYSYVASILPVWVLLQPRDYINSLQLVSALALILIGLVAAAFFGGAADPEGTRVPLTMVAPLVQWAPEGAPAIFPFLFITIACGAISGFHCLVSSGTSSKQLRSETDARFVGYGSMLLEGFLATLVVLACGAGVGLGLLNAQGHFAIGEEAWESIYGSWAAMGGLAPKVGAFVNGAANFLASIGMAREIAVALMGVLVASFAGTTLDTACRLQRYVIQELGANLRRPNDSFSIVGTVGAFLQNKHGATTFAVLLAAFVAALPPSGQPFTWQSAGMGGLLLWPLFGATNQLLGGLAFIVIFFYLRRTGKPLWFVVVPGLFMLVIPFWAMFLQTFIGTAESVSWWASGDWLLVSIGTASMALELWMVAEAARLLRQRPNT